MYLSAKFSKGDHVQLLHTDKIGEIIAVDKGQAIINFDYVTLRLPLQEVKHLPKNYTTLKAISLIPSVASTKINTLDMHKFIAFQPELDLHGLCISEALHILDKWIDQALLAGHRYLRIIHGKGKGVLREQVHDYLKTNELVTKVTANHNLPGGSGVTLIEL
ncbi:MAG: Smr/MutS family protein [Candidatus Amoebophilus sp.]